MSFLPIRSSTRVKGICISLATVLFVVAMCSCSKQSRTIPANEREASSADDATRLLQQLASQDWKQGDLAFKRLCRDAVKLQITLREGLTNNSFRIRLGCRNVLLSAGLMSGKDGARILLNELNQNRQQWDRDVAALVLSEEMQFVGDSERSKVVWQLIEGVKDSGVMLDPQSKISVRANKRLSVLTGAHVGDSYPQDGSVEERLKTYESWSNWFRAHEPSLQLDIE